MDFLAKFSRLVNGMGQSLVLSWTKLVKSGNGEEAAETLAALEAKVPLLLQLLVHEDDDISANVVGFCYEYLHVLKQVSSTSTNPGPGGRGGVTGTGSVTAVKVLSVVVSVGSLADCPGLSPQLPQLTEQQKSNIEVSLCQTPSP